ncbi:hypothetical protein ACFSKU_21520 [Pontibacter silvestris]|uniref:Uncharacterized protein n=1 Tax=Pontibacter silvestris TaxID=2305183 RepID=A0ABW4X492_9BACT|nr:hypothetical protein [Pontibacter silvestris]MCC9138800.1 hypothetical protein [Pontibacter silvestris]
MAKNQFKQALAAKKSDGDILFNESDEPNKKNNVDNINKSNDIYEDNELHEMTHFSTRITKGLYKQIRQYEYWERATISDVVEKAIKQYFEGKESAHRSLPLDRISRLKEISDNKKKAKKK